jgi:hypothetical protein
MNNPVASTWTGLPTRRELHAHLDRLEMTADAKVAIAGVIDFTAMAGDRVVEAGRRIVAFAFELLRQFPNLSFCVIVAMILNALIAGVPLLGPLLGALLGPLLLAAGFTLGAALEIRDGGLRDRVDLLTREFQAIFA